MVRCAPFVFPFMQWRTFVSPIYNKRPHVLHGNPKRITLQMDGIAFKCAATAYIKGSLRLESENGKIRNR